MFKSIRKSIPEYLLLKVMLLIMGFMVVTFNVMGYDVLFHAEPWFSFVPISPFGILLGCSEIAVLLWTSAVISEWCTTSRILKVVIWFLVPAFSFLCYSGINSYLSTLATTEIRKVEEVKVRTSNNTDFLTTLESEAASLEQQLLQLRKGQIFLNRQINEKNSQIKELSEQASSRRLKAIDCASVPDCASSVNAFEDQAALLELDVKSLNRSRDKKELRIEKLEANLDKLQSDIRSQKISDRNNKNEFAGIESSFEMKKAAYERIVLAVTGMFGFKPKDPFGVFVSFVSFLIYPVYFILNLYLALNSEGNKSLRESRWKNIRQRKSIRNALLKKVAGYLKLMVLRKKRAIIANLSDSFKQRRKRKSKREVVYKKMIRYFRVWAYRRKKIKEIEVERIVEQEVLVEKEVEKVVEVEVEVEKVVEKIKEVPVEVRVEVPVEVDKIVEVPTEVPIYIEKIKKVPEPVFVKDPQVIIHERIIPVPEDVTAEELERILDAQPRLNTDARNSESSVVI